LDFCSQSAGQADQPVGGGRQSPVNGLTVVLGGQDFAGEHWPLGCGVEPKGQQMPVDVILLFKQQPLASMVVSGGQVFEAGKSRRAAALRRQGSRVL
jgi:hypothetical protein